MILSYYNLFGSKGVMTSSVLFDWCCKHIITVKAPWEPSAPQHWGTGGVRASPGPVRIGPGSQSQLHHPRQEQGSCGGHHGSPSPRNQAPSWRQGWAEIGQEHVPTGGPDRAGPIARQGRVVGSWIPALLAWLRKGLTAQESWNEVLGCGKLVRDPGVWVGTAEPGGAYRALMMP